MSGVVQLADTALNEVSALLTEFLWRLDHAGSGSVAELFVEDGTMRTPRLEVRGRAQISDWFIQRSGRREIKTHHTWGNLRVEDASDTDLTITTRTVTLQAPVSSEAGTAAQVIVGEARDILHKVAGGWKFASRDLSVFFAGSLG